MFFILVTALIGGALGYGYNEKTGSESLAPVGIGALGGLLGGAALKLFLPLILALLGAAAGAAGLLYIYQTQTSKHLD